MELPALLAKLYLLLSSVTTENNYEQCGQRNVGRATSSSSRPFTILVEGNVGCGKSTTLEFFRNRTQDVDIVLEPVEKWQNIAGQDLLQNIADDATRWAGVFQMYSSLTRYRNVMRPTTKPLRLMERSLFSERYCFLEATHDSYRTPGGKGITDPEYLIMSKWFNLLTEQLRDHVKPDLILYIRCDLPVLLQRIKKRGRVEEVNIPIEFLQDIQQRHDDWLMFKNSSFPVPAKVMVLNGNLPIDEYESHLAEKQQEILRGTGISLD